VSVCILRILPLRVTSLVSTMLRSSRAQALRYMTILIDIADQKKQEFDELILERKTMRSEGGTPTSYVYWLHFAARPKDNRRKIGSILK